MDSKTSGLLKWDEVMKIQRESFVRTKENDLGGGEFSVIVCDERQGEGIGAALLERCLHIAEGQGYRHIWGLVLPQNRVMLSLGNKLGFQLERGPDATTYQLSIDFSQQVDHD